jgi:hypothetical protein
VSSLVSPPLLFQIKANHFSSFYIYTFKYTVVLMILSLLFSVSLGRLTTASQPRLGLTLSGNSTLIITFTITLLTLSQYANARWFHSGVHANVRPACRPHLPKVHFGRNQRSRPLQGLVYPPNTLTSLIILTPQAELDEQV